MFESKPNYRWDPPEFMREPGVTYLRIVSLTSAIPWFLMSIRWTKDEFVRNFLVASDSDLVSALKSVNGLGSLASLSCCMPTYQDGRLSWSIVELEEVWLGGEPGQSALIPICVDRQGRLLGGVSLDPMPTVRPLQLIARANEIVRPPPPEGL